MRIRPNHRALLAAGTAVLALSLTACNGDDQAAATGGGSADKPAASTSGSASAGTGTPASNEKPADTTTTGAPGTSKAPQKSSGGTSAGSGTSGGSGSTSGGGGGSANNTEAYAWKHACAMTQLSVNVRPGSGSQRIIEVSNKGTSACGLDLLPTVDLGDSNSADQSRNVRPLVPSGLGGPDHALLAGKKAYAVIDLNPGGKAGSAKGINEMNVLVSPSHMANADTRNFPIASGTQVSGPKLGLYRDSVADAVSSMKQADTPQQ
ncbi:hypothetical protein [Streptomyces laurentii]